MEFMVNNLGFVFKFLIIQLHHQGWFIKLIIWYVIKGDFKEDTANGGLLSKQKDNFN